MKIHLYQTYINTLYMIYMKIVLLCDQVFYLL